MDERLGRSESPSLKPGTGLPLPPTLGWPTARSHKSARGRRALLDIAMPYALWNEAGDDLGGGSPLSVVNHHPDHGPLSTSYVSRSVSLLKSWR